MIAEERRRPDADEAQNQPRIVAEATSGGEWLQHDLSKRRPVELDEMVITRCAGDWREEAEEWGASPANKVDWEAVLEYRVVAA
jgi:hypothetical protein